MSLILHLPLNNDLNDYSGNNYHASYNGGSDGDIIQDANGKIGKCYKTISTAKTRRITTPTITGINSDCSMFCWINVQDLGSDSSANGVVTNHDHSTESGMGITLRPVTSTTYRISCNTGYVEGGRTYMTYYSDTDLVFDTWYHVGFTYNASTKDITFYLNGKKDGVKNIGTKTMKYIDQPISVFNWSLGFQDSNSYRPQQAINDVRVYNHVLSPKEAEEISKAKIIHYKFNEKEEGTKNTLPDGNFSTRTFQSFYTTCNGGTFQFVTDNTAPTSNVALKMVASRDDAFSYPYTGINIPVQSYSYWTFSLWAKGSVGGEFLELHILPVNSSGDLISSEFATIGAYLTTEWKRYTVTKQMNNTSIAGFNVRFDNNINGDTIYINGLQLEQYDRATDFTNTSRVGIVYDSSGMSNNGVAGIYTSPEWTTESKTGLGCYNMNLVHNDYVSSPAINPINEYTVAFWTKIRNTFTNEGMATFVSISKNASTYPLWIYMNGDSKMCITSYSSTYPNAISSSELSTYKWMHVAVTSIKGGKTILYINGVKEKEFTNPGVDMPSDTNIFIGELRAGRELGIDAYIDDFRFYGSILTQEDIQSLMSNKAYLTKDGSFLVNSLQTDTSAGIKSTGVLKATDFNEVPVTDGLIAYYPLDDNANDYSGNKYHCTVGLENVSKTKGIIDGAYQFNGTSGIAATLSSTATTSVSVWAKRTESTRNSMIFSFNADSGSYGPDIYFTAGTICWNKGDSANYPFKNNGVNVAQTSLNEWHHYVVVNDETANKCTLYVDGAYYGETIYRTTLQTNKSFTIGCYFDNSSTYVWEGPIDDLKLYNRALTAKEVQILYKHGLGTVSIEKNGEIHARKFDEVLI